VAREVGRRLEVLPGTVSGPCSTCNPDDRHRRQREADKDAVPGSPPARLIVQGEAWLDQYGVGQEGEHAAQVAARVQQIGVVRPMTRGVREPSLKQRCCRRQYDEGQSDRACQSGDQPGHRIRAGSVRTGPDRERQERDRQEKHDRVHSRPLPAGLRGDEPRIPVARQQHRLEKHDARIPDHRSATGDRQDHPRDHRLDQKHQGGTGKHRDREQPRREAVSH